jgi:hypothetical protein
MLKAGMQRVIQA